MKRIHQFLLIAMFVPLCWLLMQAVHELGHVALTVATGGTVTKVVLHPLTISRTDASGSLHPLLVVWAGPAVGVGIPFTLLAMCKAAKLKWYYLVQFFAGTCLIANGAYLSGRDRLQGIGDAGRTFLRAGNANLVLVAVRPDRGPARAVPLERAGPEFRPWTSRAGKVERSAAYFFRPPAFYSSWPLKQLFSERPDEVGAGPGPRTAATPEIRPISRGFPHEPLVFRRFFR